MQTTCTNIQLNSSTSECDRLYAFLEDSLGQLPVTKEFKHDLKLAAEELLANIIRHGYQGKTGEVIDLEIAVDKHAVHMSFTDSADEFNPLESRQPDLLNDLSEGGMGILLVKSLTDEQLYRRENGHNVFTVTKNYNK